MDAPEVGADPGQHAGGERECTGAGAARAPGARRASGVRLTGSASSVSRPLVGFLVSGGADLRAREQADSEDEEHEHEREIAGRCHDRARSRAWPARAARSAEMPAEETLLETTPRMSANTPTLLVHTSRLARSTRSACAVGEESSPRRGSALSRAGSMPVPMSRRGGDPCADRQQQHARGGRKQQRERLGARERAQLLGPAEWRHPAQPAGAGGGVGDHAQQEASVPTTAPPSSSARRRVGASWLAQSANPDEHGHDRDGREREIGRRRPPGGRRRRSRRTPPSHRSSDSRRDRRHRRRRTSCAAPTIPASTSSMRPVSSSVRSARTAASSPNTAAKIASVPPTRQAV